MPWFLPLSSLLIVGEALSEQAWPKLSPEQTELPDGDKLNWLSFNVAQGPWLLGLLLGLRNTRLDFSTAGQSLGFLQLNKPYYASTSHTWVHKMLSLQLWKDFISTGNNYIEHKCSLKIQVFHGLEREKEWELYAKWSNNSKIPPNSCLKCWINTQSTGKVIDIERVNYVPE